jgi:hypothetical protein
LVRDGDPRNAANYRPVEARLRAVGRGIQIYVDEASQSQVSDEKLRMLIHTFDEVIEPRCTARFGPVADVDHDGRLTVLLTAALSELARQVGPVDGLMRGADFDTRVPTPLGNQSDVLFLNARVPAGGYLQSILAHEYAHAIIFSRRVLDEACKQPGCEEESWLDEGLAHLVEASFGFSRDNLDYRLDSFLADPENYRLVVDDYYSSRLFRSHGHRGASYLFLDWCLTHFGPGLLDVLMRSRDSGVDNLEHATATRFDDLYRAWSVALFLQSTASGQACDRVPRHTTLDPGDGEMWRGVATASHYSIVHGSSTGAVHLTITTDADADLQVTLVALPDDLPTLALRVDASPTSAVAQLRTHDAGWVVIDGFDTMPREVKPATRTSWQAVDCEIPTQPLAPASRRNVALRLPAQWERAGTMWVRVRGHDALGRPVVAWATLAGAPVR